MRILILDQFAELGGAQRCLLDLLPEIESRGWEAAAALPAGPLAQCLRSRGLAVQDISCGPYSTGRKTFRDAFRLALDLREQIRAIGDGSDLIYVNGPRLLPGAALASRGRIPVLYHAHHAIEQKSAARLAALGLRVAGAEVAACSRYVAEHLARFSSAPALVVENGVPDCGFLPRPSRPPDHWRIGVIGRISPEKGQAEFVAAAARLVPLYSSLRFSVCGAPFFASRDYLDSVCRAARDLPVDFRGWHDDIRPVLRELDLLVVPSKMEGMGRVIVEAFSAGVPVVASAVGGIPEVIDDRINGFLVRESGPEALAARIGDVLALDPAKLGAVVTNARETWQRRFTVDRYRRRMADLIASLVPNQRSALPATENTAPA